MEKNNGGAKPKTGTSSNNSNSRQGGATGSGTSQTAGAQSRNRSPRRENGYASRFNGAGGTGAVARGLRSTRSNTASSNNNNSTNSTTTTPATTTSDRRPSMLNSVTRNRYASSNQSRNNALQNYRDYSPLRNPGRTSTRQPGTSTYSRPVLRQRNPSLSVRTAEPALLSPESPTEDLVSPTSTTRSLGTRADNSLTTRTDNSFTTRADDSNDSDSESSGSASPPLMSTYLPLRPCGINRMAANNGRGRPTSATRDAVLARELLQTEMDAMLQRDEEMARQLQDEMDMENRPSPSARPLAMFMPGGGRGRHYPSIPNRQDMGRGLRGGERGGPRRLHLSHGPDGALRMGFEPRGRGGAIRLVMGPGGVRRASDSEPGSVLSDPSPTGDEDGLASSEFDPDEQLLGGELDPPVEFLSMMNDPSLMLLMLLLRAPETLYQNDGGVDLDDYEGLWELAERIGDVRHRGISDEQLGKLQTRKFKPQLGEAEAAAAVGVSSITCQICLVDFEHGDCLRDIPCRHDFHRDCIDQWLKRNATCPICRKEVEATAGIP
ncbi:E3 ubiquitin-protein ligase RLIM-like isoform X2 [Littorina saxatilis]|uniref:E3 ubiquitin-protein ligase RLIM-like isoform X2 n=1 Tax=Littorina saxatilis TaxID=31220 RepID=UPI0038B4F19F